MQQDQHKHISSDDIQYIGQLARDGGYLAREMRESVGVRTKSNPNDFVTDADIAVSKVLVQKLSEHFPGDLIISEEDQIPGSPMLRHIPENGMPSRAWLIDPIDGTENYIKQDGQYSCMIGLLIDGKPLYGWVFQPSTDTLFSGGPRFGAFKQTGDQPSVTYPIYPTLINEPTIRLMIGWGDRRKFPWVTKLPRIEYVSSDSMGLKIVKILENEADVFVSLSGRVKLWDTAAPTAIACGAGLDVGTADGSDLPFPLPSIQHGSSVIIGRPGSIEWATEHLHGHPTSSQ